MRFKIGDRVICVSLIPSKNVIGIYGDYAYRWYMDNLELNKIYTIKNINLESWEEIMIDGNTNHSKWVGENNFESLSVVRKQKLNKIKDETR